MNPKFMDTYVNGLQQTLEEKLFFIDKLGEDYFRNKIIIDFGCGDGSVLAYIAKHCDCVGSDFVAVDINNQMLRYAEEKLITPQPVFFFNKLEDALPIINTKSESTKVILIANSVFHELGEEQVKAVDFIRKYVDTFIIRDMYIDFNYAFEADNFEDLKNSLASKIIANANSKMLAQFVEKWGIDLMSFVHFLLKYTYVENWETEIQEDYLSAWRFNLAHVLPKVVYENSYAQEWRVERVKKDFDIDLLKYTKSTHKMLILER